MSVKEKNGQKRESKSLTNLKFQKLVKYARDVCPASWWWIRYKPMHYCRFFLETRYVWPESRWWLWETNNQHLRSPNTLRKKIPPPTQSGMRKRNSYYDRPRKTSGLLKWTFFWCIPPSDFDNVSILIQFREFSIVARGSLYEHCNLVCWETVLWVKPWRLNGFSCS